jgi:hypothetical protein
MPSPWEEKRWEWTITERVETGDRMRPDGIEWHCLGRYGRSHCRRESCDDLGHPLAASTEPGSEGDERVKKGQERQRRGQMADLVEGPEHGLHIMIDRYKRSHRRATADHRWVLERLHGRGSKAKFDPITVEWAFANGLHQCVLGKEVQFICTRPLAVGRKRSEGVRLEKGVSKVEDQYVWLPRVILEPILWETERETERETEAIHTGQRVDRGRRKMRPDHREKNEDGNRVSGGEDLHICRRSQWVRRKRDRDRERERDRERDRDREQGGDKPKESVFQTTAVLRHTLHLELVGDHTMHLKIFLYLWLEFLSWWHPKDNIFSVAASS